MAVPVGLEFPLPPAALSLALEHIRRALVGGRLDETVVQPQAMEMTGLRKTSKSCHLPGLRLSWLERRRSDAEASLLGCWLGILESRTGSDFGKRRAGCRVFMSMLAQAPPTLLTAPLPALTCPGASYQDLGPKP